MHTLQLVCVFVVFVNTTRTNKAEIEFEEYQDDYGPISTFNEDSSARTTAHPNEISALLMKRLAEVESLEDLLPFIGNAVEVDVGGMKVIVANTSSDFELITRTAERSNVVRATPANCKPELHTVSLIESLSPSVYHWPTCTRIERCGGCCNSELLVCEPIRKETVLMEITKIEFQRGGRPMRLSGREVIPVEKHISCKCGCRIKPSDCSEVQVYSIGDCKCNCKNIEAKRICDLDSEKIWDPSRCICFCRKERTCASGFYFDVTSCRCEQNLVRRQVDDTFSSQGKQLKGPFSWIDSIRNQEKLKQKQLHGDKEEKNKPKTTVNLWKNRNDESLD